MSDARKYYYLKLKDNYFEDDPIILLESMQNGILCHEPQKASHMDEWGYSSASSSLFVWPLFLCFWTYFAKHFSANSNPASTLTENRVYQQAEANVMVFIHQR